MADEINLIKISELTSATTPDNQDVLAGVQTGNTKKFSFSVVLAWIKTVLRATDIGAVPDTRTLNNKALSQNITINAADIPFNNAPSSMTADKVQGAIDEVNTKVEDADTAIVELAEEAIPQAGTITLSTTWTGSGPYSQTVTVTGVQITANSKVDLQPTAAQIAALIADGVGGLLVENNAGTLTAYAIKAYPAAAMTIQCTVEEIA